MRFIYQLVVFVGITLLASCGVDNSSEPSGFDSPQLGSALVPVPVEDRRVAIVHSQATKANFYDPFAYNQLFAAAQQQSMMAGMPFDLLDAAALASTANLLDYDAIIIPNLSHVTEARRTAIKARLLEAQENGVGIVTSGEFMAYKPDGSEFADSNSAMVEVLGVQPFAYLNAVSATVRVADNTHPVSKTYAANEELTAYEQIWFAGFVPVTGEQSTPLTFINSGGVDYNGSQVIERAGRVVHYSNDQLLADNNQLWRVIQWLTYGDIAPVSLQLSRSDHIFLARNDMDQAMIAADLVRTEIPLLEILKEWKRDYNFVGSYYIDIGNNPAEGEYTDWGVSAPLYQEYIALGNEIGTHSWTHPHHTSLLTAAQLEFEFKDSAAEIGARIGTPVIGAAVPGVSESLEVVETLNPWFEYLSGRSGTMGVGYPGAFGFLEPQHTMMYFSLNMTPDYGAIDFQNFTPAQTKVIWKNEIDTVLKHAQQPIVHWLWHDYGPTTQTTAGLYTKDMFTDTIAYANSLGAEFTTVKNIHDRIRTFAGVKLSVGSSNVVSATVDAANVGQFALKISEDVKIRSVANWYAYDDDQVFLPDAGGQFDITVGPSVDVVTRISKLPMRARLLELTGDGDRLSFSMEGEGEVTVPLSAKMKQNVSVTGADSFTESNGVLTLRFNNSARHTVEVTPVTPINRAPVATGGSANAETAVPTPIALAGVDLDGDALSYEIKTQPSNGTITGTAPNLVYVSNLSYIGADSFTFVANDGTLNSTAVRFDVVVAAQAVPNLQPQANELVLESVIGQPISLTLTGTDNENQPLQFDIVELPSNGVISGTAPNLIYTPNAGFSGRDSISFTVNDSVQVSPASKVVFNVESELGRTIGTITNPVASITLDGNIADWATMTSFGEDPNDISGLNNEIDWREAWMGHDNTHFYLAYREYGNAQALWGNQIYLDTDADATTGFHGFTGQFPVGADYVIEGDAVFRYTATLQNQWAWEFLGSTEVAVAGDVVELKLTRAQLGNPNNMFLFFQGDSAAAAGDALDYYPDSAIDSGAILRSRKFGYSVNPNGIENYAPVAFSQRIKITENTSYPLTLSGFDQDNDSLSFEVGTERTTGTLTGVAPNLIYTPKEGETYDFMTFTVNDGTADSNSKSVQFFVVPPPLVNSRPSANNLSLTLAPSAAMPISFSGSDIDGDALSFRVVDGPVSGTLVGTPPNMTYTAPIVGTDSFTYVANDGFADSVLATVTVSVDAQAPVNTVPQASSLSLSIIFNTISGLVLNGTDADGDTLSYTVVSQPTLGSLSGTPPQLTYIPYAGVTGSDSFSYVVNDGLSNSAAATVVIEVLAEEIPNRAPVANGQSVATAFAADANIILSGRDPEQSVLTYQINTQPRGGTLSGTAPNLVYKPNANFSGSDSFTFLVNDGELDSVSATVTIDVGEPPTPVVSNPIAGLTIDGALDDWSGLQTLGKDPADIGGIQANNPLDWRQAWVAHSSTDLFIAFRNHTVFSLSWGHGIYVDVDGDINTGFRGFDGEFPIGADYLLETNDVQQYTGTGTDWGWLTVAQSTVATAGEIGELSLPLSALNAQGLAQTAPSKLRFYFVANNSAFSGSTVDHFPDAAADITAAPDARYLEYQLTP